MHQERFGPLTPLPVDSFWPLAPSVACRPVTELASLVDCPLAHSVAAAHRARIDMLRSGGMLHPVGSQSAVSVPPS